jgi:hypothetical protein
MIAIALIIGIALLLLGFKLLLCAIVVALILILFHPGKRSAT